MSGRDARAIADCEAMMSTYSYLVVPFIGVVRGGVFSKENAQTVSSQLQTVIDGQVRQGWEFQ